ncbi:MAG: DUF3592 domain-containing protein [Anaerolineales bacterium]|nr:DUF3592 domain-containing protein [Anaerolineales bacterium]
MSADLIIGIVFSLIGGLMALIAVFLFVRTRMFMNTAQEVKGTVVRMVYSHSSDGGGGYSPVYQFKTIEGRLVEKQDSLSSNPPMFKEGQTIDVLYEPANPENARIKKWMSLYFLPLLLGGMGLIFGGIGVVLLIFRLLDSLNI